MMVSRPSSAFELLGRRVQRWIWKEEWNELRDIQEDAIPVILQGDKDVVIASATASGKTEAAFLPIGSFLSSEGEGGLGVLYISPLKALINDQHRRLEGYFDELNLPVHKWHGDVAASKKKRVVQNPSGVLLITPESLEALFVRRGSEISRIVAGLRYVVIDELHAFMGTERGQQLQSLLHRIELSSRRRIPRIALSATLGDMNLACEFLRPGDGTSVHQIISKKGRQEVQLQIRGYRITPPLLKAGEADQTGNEPQTEELVTGDQLDISIELFQKLRGGRHIVFTNTRGNVELFSDLLRRRSERMRVPNEFWPHHGNLDKALREDAEAALKATDKSATVIATTTLELGIDVGSVESIAQIGPPLSVASMRQRLGRSGRRGEPSVLRIYVQEPEITTQTPPFKQLRSGLVQAIAMVRLLVQRWYEPPLVDALHLSTLVQQLLSIIAQHGGVQAAQVWKALSHNGPFANVDSNMFAQLLRDIGHHELVTQTHKGELVLDLNGERLVNHYSFYAAFATPEEFRLVANGRTLGSLPVVFPVLEGTYLIFAGKRWRVLKVDDEHKLIELTAAAGGLAPRFSGGGVLLHERIREEMLAVYLDSDQPPFLNEVGQDLLQEGRDNFHRFDLTKEYFLEFGTDTLIFPWAGDRALNTLVLQLQDAGFSAWIEGMAIFVEDTSLSSVQDCIETLVDAGLVDAVPLANLVPNKKIEKHHRFLSDDLLAADYASSQLDVMGAYRAACRLVEK